MRTIDRITTDNIAPEASGSLPATPDLAGQPAWIISDGRAGHLAITQGIAEALGVHAELKRVPHQWLNGLLAPWGPADGRFVDALLAEPWPAIALGAGRQTVPIIRAIGRRSGGRIFTVLGQDPRTGPGSADLIWVPRHDARRGANVIATLTPPHRFSPARLARERLAPPPWTLPQIPNARLQSGPDCAVFVGGPGGGYRWTPDDIARFAGCLANLAGQGARFLITPSRRTPPELAAAVDAATSGSPRFLWDGLGDNPYAAMLAHAGLFVVTADSVNMAGEASATGRPIHVFHPGGGRPKFRAYHAALEAHGATRPLTAASDLAGAWTYPPLDAAAEVAAEIARRWRLSPAAGRGGTASAVG